jgi:RimJ/RimL family protein N-acetyltransferase
MSNTLHSLLQVPILETDRLKLRGHRLDDFPHSAAMWADPSVVRYVGGNPLTEEESWTRFLRYAGHWCLLGFGYWVVEEKATGKFAGEIGFADYKRDLEPSLKGIPEIGWVLASQAHGKGYATEAVRALTVWGDTHFGPVPTVCIIHPENHASIRVAERCEYREWRSTTYKNHSVKLFVRERKRQRQASSTETRGGS